MLPFTLRKTGAGFTKTYSHQVFFTPQGEPFPVVACIPKGYSNERFVFQQIPLKTVVARIFSECPPGGMHTSGIEFLIFEDHRTRKPVKHAVTPVLEDLLRQIDSWRSGRTCRWPPGITTITPAVIPMPKNLDEAVSLVEEVFEVFPWRGVWCVCHVLEQQPFYQRGLRIFHGIDNHWHYPEVLPVPATGFLSFSVAHHNIRFSSPCYLVRERKPSRYIMWAETAVFLTVEDTRTGEVNSLQLPAGFFQITHFAHGRD